jgi:quercetin dioxygenase-like cupin family protein
MASKGMFFIGEQTAQVEMMTGVLRRTLGHGAQMLLAEFTLAAGSEVTMHSHHHDQVGYVVSGSMELTIQDEARTCEAGDSYYIPGDVPHKAAVAEGAVVIDVFNPPREDYLDS